MESGSNPTLSLYKQDPEHSLATSFGRGFILIALMKYADQAHTIRYERR